MRFFIGLHQRSDAKHFSCCFISVNRLRGRKSDFEVGEWIMDSGAFTEVTKHGTFRTSVAEYASEIKRWSRCGKLLAAVSQDFLCNKETLAKTGLTVKDHQQITVTRYRELLEQKTGTYIMPVLQGNTPEEYAQHVALYGGLLGRNAWVGVGSIVRISSEPTKVEDILRAILKRRPDLRLHGFGLKYNAFHGSQVADMLFSSDSCAWSMAARREGRNQNDWREAEGYRKKVVHLVRGQGLAQ